MRRVFAIAAALLGITSGGAWGQGQIPGGTLMGREYGEKLGPPVGVPMSRVGGMVASHTALQAMSGAAGGRMKRLGYTVPGDGGVADYDWSETNCSNADGGAQVQPSMTGCWIADFSGRMPIPEIWGAKGDGIADDAVAVKAGLAYVAVRGGKLYGRPGSKYGIGSTITIGKDTEFAGVNWDRSQIVLLDGSVSPAVKLEGQAVLRDWYVDATPQNSGIVIQMGSTGNDYRSLVSRVMTNKGCIALDVNGISHTVKDSVFELMSATAGCGGMRVGHDTQLGTVELRVVDTLIKCDYTLPTRADFGMLLEDVEGSYFSNNDVIGCIRGTIIKPGADQRVDLNFFSNTVLGDTSQEENLLIDAGAATSFVRSNMFVNTWTSGGTSPGGTGIRIKNTGAGLVSGLNFIGHRALQNYNNGVEVAKPAAGGTISEVTFDNLRVCNTQLGTDVLIGDDLDITIRNSRLGKACDGYAAGSTTGLVFGLGLGTNVQLIATGNDFTYGGAEFWSPISGVPARNSVVANNSIDALPGATYASASTVTLNQTFPRIHLTGTAAVNTITPAWNGQSLCIISDSGVVNFGTTGNIAAPAATSGAWGMVCGVYDGNYSKWYLH